MSRYTKWLLWLAAGLMIAFENFALAFWISEHGTFPAAFRNLRDALLSDWLLLFTVTDLLLFALLVLVWIWRDALRCGFGIGARLLLLIATTVIGSPVVLVYLATRPEVARV